MLKIFHTILLLIIATITYAQTKKNKVNVKFNMDYIISVSKLKDWRINEMNFINQTTEFNTPILPSLLINSNEKWELGISFYNISQLYFLKGDDNWKEQIRYSNPDSFLILGRNIQSFDISFGLNLKKIILKSTIKSTFIKKSNIYLSLAAKILNNKTFYNRNYIYIYYELPHYIATQHYTISRSLALRPKIELTYSYDVFKWLQLRANINYSYIFKDDAPLMIQAGIGFKF